MGQALMLSHMGDKCNRVADSPRAYILSEYKTKPIR